ncbi:MAG: hypothetical protein GX800_11690 [Clostridiaceae bacterium]|nr:hypothetical protein [Clostridiaceae bacterium]
MELFCYSKRQYNIKIVENKKGGRVDKKKILLLLLLLCFVFTMFIQLAVASLDEDDAIILYVDSNTALVNSNKTQVDKDVLVTPVVENGRTLVPVRFIAESFNMVVDYNDRLEVVTITGGSKDVRYTIGSNIMSSDGVESLIDADKPDIIAKTINDRTLIPIRSFAQAIGKEVFYDRGLIIISDDADSLNGQPDKALIDSTIEMVNVVPVVGSSDNLEKLLQQYGLGRDLYIYADGDSVRGMAAEAVNDIAVQAPSAGSFNKSKADEISYADHSETNVQVTGVDEADIVKTDGNYLYPVSGQKI